MSRIISARSDPLGADRQVPVGMVAIEQLRERAIGERRRHVLQLQQPVAAAGRGRDRTRAARSAAAISMSRTSSRPRSRIALERRQAEDRGVVADVDVELRADAAERFVHVERGAIAAALVEHVAGDRGEPGPVRRIRRRARPAPARARDTSGTWWCSTVHTRRPFGSVVRRIAGNVNGRSGPSAGRRLRSAGVMKPPPAASRRARGRRGRAGRR